MNRQQRRAAERNRLATTRGIDTPQTTGGHMGQDREARAADFKDEFQQRMLDRLTSDTRQQGTDPDLLAVLRELRDNTGRIARALEGR